MEMKQSKFKPGHLKENGLNLEQTEKVRRSLSSAGRARHALQRIGEVRLNWKGKK